MRESRYPRNEILRILLADDHPVVRRQLREILEAEVGLSVCGEAENGAEAVRLTAAEHPDIVILDLSMPEMNGLEAARHIHEQFPSTELFIVTMYGPLELDEMMGSGIRSCILKTDLQQLVTAVHNIRQQRVGQYSGSPQNQVSQLNGDSVPVQGVEDPNTLTDFERRIVQMLARARSNKEIATAFSLSVEAVEAQRAAIMSKLRISSIFDLVHYALRTKLVEAQILRCE